MSKGSVPLDVGVLDLDVGKLPEFLVSSIHEKDAGPVYSHNKLDLGQRGSCDRRQMWTYVTKYTPNIFYMTIKAFLGHIDTKE